MLMETQLLFFTPEVKRYLSRETTLSKLFQQESLLHLEANSFLLEHQFSEQTCSTGKQTGNINEDIQEMPQLQSTAISRH